MAGRSKSKATSTQPAAFYKGALSKAERVQFSKAREVVGLDQEISLLRLKLRQLLEQDPDKVEMLFKGVNLLLRAVATRYRLSPRLYFPKLALWQIQAQSPPFELSIVPVFPIWLKQVMR